MLWCVFFAGGDNVDTCRDRVRDSSRWRDGRNATGWFRPLLSAEQDGARLLNHNIRLSFAVPLEFISDFAMHIVCD